MHMPKLSYCFAREASKKLSPKKNPSIKYTTPSGKNLKIPTTSNDKKVTKTKKNARVATITWFICVCIQQT